jgi:hypothetical protein
VKVKRVPGRKRFVLPLVDLKATDRHSENYQLLHDYPVWVVNWRQKRYGVHTPRSGVQFEVNWVLSTERGKNHATQQWSAIHAWYHVPERICGA